MLNEKTGLACLKCCWLFTLNTWQYTSCSDNKLNTNVRPPIRQNLPKYKSAQWASDNSAHVTTCGHIAMKIVSCKRKVVDGVMGGLNLYCFSDCMYRQLYILWKHLLIISDYTNGNPFVHKQLKLLLTSYCFSEYFRLHSTTSNYLSISETHTFS